MIGGDNTAAGAVTYAHVLSAGGNSIPGLFTHSRVPITGGYKKRVITHGCVMGARHVVPQGPITERIIFDARCIARKRYTAIGIVEVCVAIKERKGAESIVVRAAVVMEERFSSNGRVQCSAGISVEGCKTSGRVIIGAVAVERTITVGGVVTAGCVVGERITASGTIEKPAGVAKERINASSGV